MARPLRHQVAGGHYHVIARGVAGEPVVRDDGDRTALQATIERTAARYFWVLHAYCLMATHLHLVVETPAPNLAQGMHRILFLHAQSFNDRWGRFGHLFADRYKSYVIEDERYFEEVCRYVLDNPVRAALCARATDWRWSGGLTFLAMSRDRPSNSTRPLVEI